MAAIQMTNAMTDVGVPVRLSWAHASEVGARAANQDAIGAALDGGLACFVIADGTGGHHGGEVASRIAVDAVIKAFRAAPAFGAPALLSYAAEATSNVAAARRADPQLADMSTTVAALLIDQQTARAVWVHLGDSRVYLFRAGRVHAVTTDHSLAQQLIDAGYAGAGELRLHPQRNILLAAIGAEGDFAVAPSAEFALEAGDALLVCSDGLWEWVLEDEMEQALSATTGSEEWLAALCARADAAVGAAGKARDNYSAYAIRVHPPLREEAAP
ncbi:MAG: Serine/threonine protein phosphatase [Massilia sp.]|jgi:serine/threonine protein phosphatase PrpC|nr:Serine/threonine protein phosphatase [Massilia sp.]